MKPFSTPLLYVGARTQHDLRVRFREVEAEGCGATHALHTSCEASRGLRMPCIECDGYLLPPQDDRGAAHSIGE